MISCSSAAPVCSGAWLGRRVVALGVAAGVDETVPGGVSTDKGGTPPTVADGIGGNVGMGGTVGGASMMAMGTGVAAGTTDGTVGGGGTVGVLGTAGAVGGEIGTAGVSGITGGTEVAKGRGAAAPPAFVLVISVVVVTG